MMQCRRAMQRADPARRAIPDIMRLLPGSAAIVLLALTLLLTATVASQQSGPVVHVARIEGIIDLGLAPHVQRVDRKSTRLNSSHVKISYAVFCLKKKRLKQLTPNV